MPDVLTFVAVHWDGDQRAGPTRFLERLVFGVDRTRFRPIVVFLQPGRLVEQFRQAGITVYVLNAPRTRYAHRSLVVVLRLAAIARAERAAVLFANGGKEHLYAGVAARLVRRPAVWCSHNAWDPADRLNRLLECVPVAAVVANSRYTRSILPARLQSRCQVVDFGVEIRDDRGDLTAAAARLREGIGHPAHVISSIGVLAPVKGQRYLIEAAPAVLKRMPDARFLIIGGPTTPPYERNVAYAHELAALVRQLGIEDRVLLLGDRRDVPAILAASDVVVQPRVDAETFGFAIAEAMAAGRPVIASRLGAQQELIADGETGLLVPPADSAALAEAVIKLLEAPEPRTRMGQAARHRAMERYRVERMIRQLEQLLLGVAGTVTSTCQWQEVGA